MRCEYTVEKSGGFCDFEKGHAGPCGFKPLNARYDHGWYYCWLIERRDTPEPQWFGADCMWHKNANDAEWFARKSDAEKSAAECPHDVVVCEHGFMLEDRR